MKLVDNKPKKVYICDPEKNKKCSGRYSNPCGKRCFCTTNKKYAVDPDHPLTQEEYNKEDIIRNVILKKGPLDYGRPRAHR